MEKLLCCETNNPCETDMQPVLPPSFRDTPGTREKEGQDGRLAGVVKNNQRGRCGSVERDNLHDNIPEIVAQLGRAIVDSEEKRPGSFGG